MVDQMKHVLVICDHDIDEQDRFYLIDGIRGTHKDEYEVDLYWRGYRDMYDRDAMPVQYWAHENYKMGVIGCDEEEPPVESW